MSSLVDGQEITLRHLAVRDLARIQELYLGLLATQKDELTAMIDNPVRLSWEMRRLRQQLLADQRYVCFVAEFGGTILGYCAGVIENQAPIFKVSTYCAVNEIFVEERFRRRGIGRSLMMLLFEQIRSMGIHWVNVSLLGKSLDSKLFLEKLGFNQGSVEMRMALP